MFFNQKQLNNAKKKREKTPSKKGDSFNFLCLMEISFAKENLFKWVTFFINKAHVVK